MIVSYIFFVAIESICIYAFYKKVICKDIVNSHSLLCEIKRFCVNFLKCITCFLKIDWKKEGWEKEEEEIFEEICRGVGEMIMALVVFFIYPSILSFMWSSMKEENILFCGILFAVGIKVIIEELMKHKERIVERIIFMIHINRFFREQRDYIFSCKKRIKWKYVFLIGIMAFLSIFTANGVVRIENVINQNEMVVKIVGGIAFICLCIDSVVQEKRKKKEYESQEKEIIIEGERLKKCRNEILRMCQETGIMDIEIREERGMGVIAQACYEKNKKSQVIIDTDILEILEEKSGKEKALTYLKVLVAHELIHIKYRDSQNVIKNIRKIILGGICFMGVGIMCIFMARDSIMWWFGACIEIIVWACVSICSDKRYWLQLQEIRADNMGMTLVGASENEINDINKILIDIKEKEQEDKNIIYRMYLRYMSEQGHINMDRRIKAIELRRTWGFYYYVWLLFEIVRGLLRKEGWYGKE